DSCSAANTHCALMVPLRARILRFWGDAGRVCGFADPDRAFRIAFLRRRDYQILRPRRYFAKLANCFCRYAHVSIRLDMHCSGQSANRHLQRGHAFGLVFHVGFLTRREKTASGSVIFVTEIMALVVAVVAVAVAAAAV